MVRVSPSLAAKIGKGLATPAAPSVTTHGVAKDFFREVLSQCFLFGYHVVILFTLVHTMVLHATGLSHPPLDSQQL